MLLWWGNAIIATGGVSVAYFYYKDTPDFAPNPDRSSLNGNNKTATINFLSMFLVSIFVYIALSGSRPFKKSIFTNGPVAVMLAISFSMITCFFFLSDHLHFLQIEPIGLKEAVTVYVIILITGCLNIAYSAAIRSAELYKNQFPRQHSGFLKLKELTHSI